MHALRRQWVHTLFITHQHVQPFLVPLWAQQTASRGQPHPSPGLGKKWRCCKLFNCTCKTWCIVQLFSRRHTLLLGPYHRQTVSATSRRWHEPSRLRHLRRAPQKAPSILWSTMACHSCRGPACRAYRFHPWSCRGRVLVSACSVCHRGKSPFSEQLSSSAAFNSRLHRRCPQGRSSIGSLARSPTTTHRHQPGLLCWTRCLTLFLRSCIVLSSTKANLGSP